MAPEGLQKCLKSLERHGFYLFIFGLLLAIATNGIRTEKCSENDIKEKVEKANVVVSGTIERKYSSLRSDGVYPCDLKVMLIFKGQGLVTSNKLKVANNMIHVEGFGSNHICNSDVHLSDTKLFFLDCDGKTTKLNSGILPVTMETLQVTEAIAKKQANGEILFSRGFAPVVQQKFDWV